jgi:hypothetical protein
MAGDMSPVDPASKDPITYAKSASISALDLVTKQPGRPPLDYALRRRIIYSIYEDQAAQPDYLVGG